MALPLDPDSPRGRQLREDLSEVFAQVQLNILAREATAKLDAASEQDAKLRAVFAPTLAEVERVLADERKPETPPDQQP